MSILMKGPTNLVYKVYGISYLQYQLNVHLDHISTKQQAFVLNVKMGPTNLELHRSIVVLQGWGFFLWLSERPISNNIFPAPDVKFHFNMHLLDLRIRHVKVECCLCRDETIFGMFTKEVNEKWFILWEFYLSQSVNNKPIPQPDYTQNVKVK